MKGVVSPLSRLNRSRFRFVYGALFLSHLDVLGF